MRSPFLRRSWLFLPGADQTALIAAKSLHADVLIQELEDFTPPERLPEAYALASDVYADWRHQGSAAAVRINPLEAGGIADLEAIMPGRPDIVLMSKVAEPLQVVALAKEIGRLEKKLGILIGATEIVPNIESARGVMQTYAIATASPRISGVMGSTEDMAADLGAPRTREAQELSYARQRMHLETVAAKLLSIDGPYTFGDNAGCGADTRYARSLGYVAKSAVHPDHIAIINKVMTPSSEEIVAAKNIVVAFEAARARGEDRGRIDDLLVEVPTYLSAVRLLNRATEFQSLKSDSIPQA